MEHFSDEELSNIKIMAVKYFSKESFRKVLVMRNDYILVERLTKVFRRNGIILPAKYDNDIHDGITDVIAEFVNSKEGKDNFRKIFLVSMRNYDFVVVLFPKKDNINYEFEMYNLGYNIVSYFIKANDEEFDDSDKREGTIIAGVEPSYFTVEF